MTDCDKCKENECDQRGASPVCPRRETQDMSRRNCQDHGFIEDYEEYDLVPLDVNWKEERRSVILFGLTYAIITGAVLALCLL